MQATGSALGGCRGAPHRLGPRARAVLAGVALGLIAGRGSAQDVWEPLEPGLELGTFHAAPAGASAEAVVRVLRIDPRRFALRLLNASATSDGTPHTARQWCERHGLRAAINASMYQADYRTSVSLMRTRAHVNNPRLSKDNAVLAFDALSSDVPPVQIIDRSCQNFDALRTRYGTLVQSIRMVSCERRNVWTPQPEKWSTAAIGTDTHGRVLFIHVRTPLATHDVVELLLALPVALKNAMYVEGGPQAQLYVESRGRRFEFVGGYDAGPIGSETLLEAAPIPNVVGVSPRTSPG
jgi:hypothetical protein